MSKKLECDGACALMGECVGEVKKVKVMRKGIDWGNFEYCETAIKEDVSRGFEVIDLPQTDKE